MTNWRVCLPILLAITSLFATDIPRGTKITVRTSTAVTSDRSLFGDPVDVQLVNDLVVSGKVIAPAGSIAHATVASVTPSTAGKYGSPGSISLRLENIETSEGTYHLSTNQYTRVGRGTSQRPLTPNVGVGVSIDPMGGVQRQSPFPVTDPSEVGRASNGGPEAIIPSDSIVTFRTTVGASPAQKK
jgi:hypothetical protein